MTEIILFASNVERVTAANEAMIIGVTVRSDMFSHSRAFKLMREKVVGQMSGQGGIHVLHRKLACKRRGYQHKGK